MTTSSHSQRSTSARRRTYSPTQAVTAMGKQSHHHHHHVFATPSPVKGKGNPFSRPMILIHQLLPQVALSQINVNNIKLSQNIPQNEVVCTIEQPSHQQNNSLSSPPLEPHLLPITNLEPVPHYGPLRYHPSS